MAREGFDVLVVGAGSAGCALTGRLTASSGLSIGLVEAGPDYGSVNAGRWPPELLDARRAPKTHDFCSLAGKSCRRLLGPQPMRGGPSGARRL